MIWPEQIGHKALEARTEHENPPLMKIMYIKLALSITAS